MSRSLLLRAYAAIGMKTPIPADCGSLCDSYCCHGGKEDGMLLFPGEEKLLASDPHFLISETVLRNKPVYQAICHGRCHRTKRPLSCRIYPFAPYLCDRELCIIPDARAKYLCPLLADDTLPMISSDFLNALQKAFSILAQDMVYFNFLMDFSAMQGDYRRFIENSHE